MLRVLLVDDDETIRFSVAQVLSGAGHMVIEVNDGRKALKTLETESFDVLITDLFMPEIDGLELIRTLSDQSPAIPIIAISGGGLGGRDEFLEAAELYGTVAALTKPLDPDELLAAVSAAAPGSAIKTRP